MTLAAFCAIFGKWVHPSCTMALGALHDEWKNQAVPPNAHFSAVTKAIMGKSIISFVKWGGGGGGEEWTLLQVVPCII
jgi:hypothetical protein